MAEFKVGGKVVCVDDKPKRSTKPLPVSKNRIYSIIGISYSPCCNDMLLDLGFTSEVKKVNCNSCQSVYARKDNIYWMLSFRFLPLDDFQQVTYTKILETVPIGAQ